MANQRDSSKQKRARQNRAQREAREARAKAAAIPAEERKAKYASGTPDAAPEKKARADRPRPERRVRLGDVPVDIDALEGNWYHKRLSVPGGRQVLTGAVLTVVITVLTVITKYPDPDATGKAAEEATESFFDIYGAAGIPLLLLPILAMAVSTWCILSPNRRKIWIISSFVAAIGAVVLGIPYIFPVAFLVYAVMRANKIEGPVPGSRAHRAMVAQEAAATREGSDPDEA